MVIMGLYGSQWKMILTDIGSKMFYQLNAAPTHKYFEKQITVFHHEINICLL